MIEIICGWIHVDVGVLGKGLQFVQKAVDSILDSLLPGRRPPVVFLVILKQLGINYSVNF